MGHIEWEGDHEGLPQNVYPFGNTRPIHNIRRYSYDYLLFSMVLFSNKVNSLALIRKGRADSDSPFGFGAAADACALIESMNLTNLSIRFTVKNDASFE